MESYSRAGVERAMKVQEVILQAMARKITWYQPAEIIGISDRHMRRYGCWFRPQKQCPTNELLRIQWHPRRAILHPTRTQITEKLGDGTRSSLADRSRTIYIGICTMRNSAAVEFARRSACLVAGVACYREYDSRGFNSSKPRFNAPTTMMVMIVRSMPMPNVDFSSAAKISRSAIRNTATTIAAYTSEP